MLATASATATAIDADVRQSLIIFDTTLRDGEQSPGVTLTCDEKVEIAQQLSRLGVDVCEAGFPVASRGDFEAVQRIAREVGPLMHDRAHIGRPMRICGLARATRADIQCAFDAVRDAPLHRIHTFLATSDIHLEHKLRLTRDECLQKAADAVRFARSLCDDVEFSPEDAGRSDPAFLCKVLGAVIDAGATTLNIPDTVGYNTPEEYGSLIAHLRQHTPNADKVIWSTHCHNDLGLATANALAGVMNGARQVEVTVNGIGERAGNTALEEVVMALYTHPKRFPVFSNINTAHIYRISQIVSQRTGMMVQSNKAIVGANAFSHESGIHQDGFLKCQQTYEIIHPSVVGVPCSQLVLGKHSGRNAVKNRLAQLGYQSVVDDQARFEKFFESFKRTADAKKNMIDDDLVALLEDERGRQSIDLYAVQSVQVVSNTATNAPVSDAQSATATVALLDLSVTPNRVLVDAAVGQGPVHAIFQCINRLTGLRKETVLVDYEVKSVTEGTDALGKVCVRLGPAPSDDDTIEQMTPLGIKKRPVYQGHGTHWDVLTASAKAYVNALNRLLHAQNNLE